MQLVQSLVDILYVLTYSWNGELFTTQDYYNSKLRKMFLSPIWELNQGFMFLRLKFLRGSDFSSWNFSVRPGVQVSEARIPHGVILKNMYPRHTVCEY